MDIREVGVVGLGTMGAGIAEVFARAGLRVTAVEADAGALSAGMSLLDRSLRKLVSHGRLTQDEYAEIAGRVRPGPAIATLSGADLVIEVVPEQLAVKRAVISELDQVLRPAAIIATNTSSLSVTSIAAGSAHPGRVVGMHFFNPAPVMRLVEVVTTVLTEPVTAAAVTALATRLGKTPVLVNDRPHRARHVGRDPRGACARVRRHPLHPGAPAAPPDRRRTHGAEERRRVLRVHRGTAGLPGRIPG